jgi:hypothetical protein
VQKSSTLSILLTLILIVQIAILGLLASMTLGVTRQGYGSAIRVCVAQYYSEDHGGWQC